MNPWRYGKMLRSMGFHGFSKAPHTSKLAKTPLSALPVGTAQWTKMAGDVWSSLSSPFPLWNTTATWSRKILNHGFCLVVFHHPGVTQKTAHEWLKNRIPGMIPHSSGHVFDGHLAGNDLSDPILTHDFHIVSGILPGKYINIYIYIWCIYSRP